MSMPERHFAPLFDQYRAIITQMPETFTSHEFIVLCWEGQNPRL